MKTGAPGSGGVFKSFANKIAKSTHFLKLLPVRVLFSNPTFHGAYQKSRVCEILDLVISKPQTKINTTGGELLMTHNHNKSSSM